MTHVVCRPERPSGHPRRHGCTATRIPAGADRARRARITSVSSEELAAAAGVRSAKLRKDLSYLGSYGVRGVGYEVDHLAYQISRELGLTQDWPVAIVGMGNLGHALAAYSGFATRGFRVVALLDQDPVLIGEDIAGIRVRPMSEPAHPRRGAGPGHRRHRHAGRLRAGGVR